MSIAPRVPVTTGTLPARISDTRVLRIPDSISLPLFATTLFFSAFLMFLLEPMVAKMLLPILGGAPMVWNTCVVFFQVTLLAGYGYAHATGRRLDVLRHRSLHLVVVAVPLAVLPFAARPDWTPPPGNPILWLLVVLATAVGLPFFALATSASVLQHWFARTDHTSARDPYFLYAASNLGSLLALAVYPTVIEPLLPLGAQSRLWAMGYAAFVLLIAACAFVMHWHGLRGDAFLAATSPARTSTSQSDSAVSPFRRARWLLLSFAPSSLMLGVTSYVSTDIAAVPLMWVVPLSLYLITFVLAFSTFGDRARAIARRAAPILVVALVGCWVTDTRGPLLLIVPLHLAAFASLALHCHGDLAHDRPSASRLTEYYFWISLGGMLGGLFNTLVAPAIFSGIVEYPLALVLACLCASGALVSIRRAAVEGLALWVGIGAVTAAAVTLIQRAGAAPVVLFAAAAILSLIAFSQRRSPVRFAASTAGILTAAALFANVNEPILHAERTFFGVYRVMQDRHADFRALAHGTTLHGMQALDPARRHEALTYFHRTGPFGQALGALPAAGSARDIAVIGLGVGTLGTYAQPGQTWTFFEIDPAVDRIARTSAYFTFLDDCGDTCRVVFGDARLSLLKTPSKYDLIVLDAFSSDAIPVHLMTKEALSLYVSHLTPSGVLLFHISNRHLQLSPVLARLASSLDLLALEQVDLMKKPEPTGKTSSDWMIMARTRADLGPLVRDARWFVPRVGAGTPLWTDDFSNILSVLSLR